MRIDQWDVTMKTPTPAARVPTFAKKRKGGPPAQYVVENGDIGVLTENYVQYDLPGSINGTAGAYQVGGDWAGNVFNITHSFFSPF